jgi:hypothetical protein
MAERRAADAADASDPPDGPDGPGGPGGPDGPDGRDAPDALLARPRRGIAFKVFIGLGVLLLLLRLGIARRPQPPALAASCTTPAFALSTMTVKQARPLSYAIVGPDAGRYVIGVNTTEFRHKAEGGYEPVPIPGRENDVIVAAGVKPMKNCRRTGFFALPIALGDARVTLYELTPTGSRELARETVTVTKP